MDLSSIKNLIIAEKKFLKYRLSLIDTQELKNIHLVKFNENI